MHGGEEAVKGGRGGAVLLNSFICQGGVGARHTSVRLYFSRRLILFFIPQLETIGIIVDSPITGSFSCLELSLITELFKLSLRNMNEDELHNYVCNS